MSLQESAARADYVRTLQPPSKIHLSGICGTGMSAVAVLLKQLGFYVQGSDKAFYPPMGDVVRKTADKIFEGYKAENLAEKPDLVVVGNNLSRNNPEVEYLLKEGIPYASMPEVFQALLIGTREHCPTSVVVTGTHGKTTTSAAIATMFDAAGRKPGFFIGGVPLNLPDAIRPVDTSIPLADRVVVLEGDEYDSAYFAKWSKFHSYRPDIAIITSIEFDHADIYNTTAEIEAEFTNFVKLIPATGALLLSDHWENLRRLAKEWKPACPVYFYGSKPDSQFRLLRREVVPGKNGHQRLEMQLQYALATVHSPLSGEHNAENLLAAAAAGFLAGLSPVDIGKALSTFSGVLRRQFIYGDFGGVMLVEDFAHHPTAVDVTLKGLKERYPTRRLIAVYEPRSNTSRRGFFQDDYPKSFDGADEIVMLEITDPGSYSKTQTELKPLDVRELVGQLQSRGKKSSSFPTVEEIEKYLLNSVHAGDVICCMSNGDFGGLVQQLEKKLAR